MRKHIFIFIFVFQALLLKGQFSGSPFYPAFNSDNKIDTSSIYFSIKVTSFFKNNEFFSDFEQGYTLPGYSLHPKLIAKPYEKLQIEFGTYFLQYHGRNKLTELAPTLRIVYSPNENFKLISGNLYGTLNHQMSDLIFDTENYFIDNIENGVQILYKKNKFNTDVWLDWQNFILHGDDDKERFTFGSSSSYKILQNTNKLSLNFQSIITHRGGQIDISPISMQTLINSSSGIKYKRELQNRKSLKLYSEFLTFADVSPSKEIPFIQGYGVHSGATFSTGKYTFDLGHFFSSGYVSARGKPIFNTVSNFKEYHEKNRAVIISKITFRKNIYKIFSFAADFDGFYDLYNNTFDYSYGLYLIIKLDSRKIRKYNLPKL